MRTGYFAAAILVVGHSAGAAHATPTYSVQVWTGAPDGVNASTIADLAHQPTGLASATFLYNGAINWNADGSKPGNTFGDFLNVDLGTNPASPRGTYTTVDQFSAATMSTSGDTIDSYFHIAGNYDAGAADFLGSFMHDDGASLYVDGALLSGSPSETTAVTDNFTLPNGVHSFDITYVEANGAPSVLDVTFPDAVNVPEPVSMALLSVGLLSLGVARRKFTMKD